MPRLRLGVEGSGKNIPLVNFRLQSSYLSSSHPIHPTSCKLPTLLAMTELRLHPDLELLQRLEARICGETAETTKVWDGKLCRGNRGDVVQIGKKCNPGRKRAGKLFG